MGYWKVGEISEPCREALIACLPRFSQIGGNPGQEANYQTTQKMTPEDFPGLFFNPELSSIPANRQQAIAVKVPPGGKVHKHIHNLDRDQNKTRFHVVLETNDECECRNGDSTHLEYRGIYLMEPYLEHESWNRGASDRVHLIFVTLDV